MMKMIYFAYPYSSDPDLRSREIQDLIHKLVEIRKDIVPLVPHYMFDALYDFPTGYGCTFMLGWELEILTRVDYICIVPSPERVVSGGIYWEKEFCRWYGTPEIDWEYLLDGGDI